MWTRVDREAGDSALSATLPGLAQAAAFTTQHQSNDGNYRVSGWIAASDVRGTPSAITRLQLSTIHGFQRPDDDVRLDATRRALRGVAGQLFAGKVGGGSTRYDASFRWIAPGFDVNEMGFLMSAGLRSVVASAGLRASRPGVLAGVPYRSASVTLAFAGDWSSSGLALGRTVSATGSMQLMNQWQLRSTLAQQLPGAYCTMICTRGGPALVDPPRTAASLDVSGDPRRRLVPHGNMEWYRDDGGRSGSLTGQVDFLWHARTNLDLSLIAAASHVSYDSFFYRWFGVPNADTAHLTFARLEQPVRALTARLDYTMTPTLSVQWYAQVYLSRGAYSNIRALASARARRYEERFVPYADTTVTRNPDGVDFRQLRSNAVIRWEYRPGSTLFIVWTQRRHIDSSNSGTLRTGPDLRELFSRRPDNVLAIKLSYWLSR
jgi:hypothetical protein